MGKRNHRRSLSPASAPGPARRVVRTAEFERWRATLSTERQGAVDGATLAVLAGGPNLGRPRVDVIQRSRLHKLKEARVDRGMRLLFAFDSNRDLVMLVGGDKTGTWNRWYPGKINEAERLYTDHERSIGKEVRALTPRETWRKPSPRSL